MQVRPRIWPSPTALEICWRKFGKWCPKSDSTKEVGYGTHDAQGSGNRCRAWGFALGFGRTGGAVHSGIQGGAKLVRRKAHPEAGGAGLREARPMVRGQRVG